MPRNSTGVFVLPEPPFVTGTVIESSVMNSQLADIASALTTSLATEGISFMTGPLAGFVGNVQNPGYRFSSFLGAGFYTATGQLGFAVSSVSIGNISTSGTATWNYPHFFSDGAVFYGGVSVDGAILASVTITGDLIVQGGLVVGFDATAENDKIILGDENFYLDYNDGDNIIFNFDDGDFLFYNRTNNEYTFEINNQIVYSLDLNSAFFSNNIRLPVLTTPASAPSNQAGIYPKDNSGISRVVYINDQGEETFMGGPGQWEKIDQTDLTTSVSSITYNLTKIYKRIVIAIGRLLCNSGTGHLVANVSDNGSTLVSCRSTIVSDNSNVFATAQLSIMRVAGTPEISLKAEINRADQTSRKQWNSIGSRPNSDTLYFNAGYIENCSAIDTIVLQNTAANMVSGRIVLYGLLSQ